MQSEAFNIFHAVEKSLKIIAVVHAIQHKTIQHQFLFTSFFIEFFILHIVCRSLGIQPQKMNIQMQYIYVEVFSYLSSSLLTGFIS